jgi:hypothetical protein
MQTLRVPFHQGNPFFGNSECFEFQGPKHPHRNGATQLPSIQQWTLGLANGIEAKKGWEVGCLHCTPTSEPCVSGRALLNFGIRV